MTMVRLRWSGLLSFGRVIILVLKSVIILVLIHKPLKAYGYNQVKIKHLLYGVLISSWCRKKQQKNKGSRLVNFQDTNS